jgi:hypothetical protein
MASVSIYGEGGFVGVIGYCWHYYIYIIVREHVTDDCCGFVFVGFGFLHEYDL